MGDELLRLRQSVLDAASRFYAAQGRYFASLDPARSRGELNEEARAALGLAEEYQAAVADLLAYLASSEAGEDGEAERARAQRLLATLCAEIELIVRG